MNEQIINEINKIYIINNISSFRNYLNNIDKIFHSLNKKEQKKFIKELNNISSNICYNNFINNLFKEYSVLKNKESFIYLLSSQLIRINTITDFDIILNELRMFSNGFKPKGKTLNINKTQIDEVIKIIYSKYPNFKNILSNINLSILIINIEDKYYNSTSIPSSNFKQFNIYCYCMKDNNEYKEGKTNPIYVLLHEIGHVICWLATNKLSQ